METPRVPRREGRDAQHDDPDDPHADQGPCDGVGGVVTPQVDSGHHNQGQSAYDDEHVPRPHKVRGHDPPVKDPLGAVPGRKRRIRDIVVPTRNINVSLVGPFPVYPVLNGEENRPGYEKRGEEIRAKLEQVIS